MNRNLAFLGSTFAIFILTEWNAAIAGSIDLTAYNTGASTPWNSNTQTLINTGGNFNAGVPDAHWKVRQINGTDETAYAVSNSYMHTTKGYSTNPKSLWITAGNPVRDQMAGVYVYSTSFSFPANYPRPLLIEGEFLSDNGIQEVRLNGIKILGTIQGSPTNPTFYNTKTAVHLFNNTLEFFVTNDTDSFTGFNNTFTRAQAVPEASTLMLSMCGAGIAIIIRLRSCRCWQAKGRKNSQCVRGGHGGH